MKKILFVVFAILSISAATAQKSKKNFDKVLSRAGDHLMLQVSSDHWLGAPDSVNSHIKPLSRGGNIYVMLDKPFKGSPQFSAAFGIGVSTSSMYFKTMGVDLRSLTTTLPFVNQDSSNHFKKYKLSTAYLEIPVEIRYTFDPTRENKSIKLALGVKAGVLMNAHTKGKSPEDKSGNSVNSYIEKENSKRFVNSTRISATGRVGYGHYSLFGSYQINSMFKTGVSADMKLLQVGLTISGL